MATCRCGHGDHRHAKVPVEGGDSPLANVGPCLYGKGMTARQAVCPCLSFRRPLKVRPGPCQAGLGGFT